MIGVIGTFNSGCAADHHPGAEPGAGRRHRDDLAGEHVRLPDGERRRRCEATRARQVLPVGHAQLRPRRRERRLPGRCAWPSSLQTQGIKNVYILNDKEAYGLGVATNFRNAAESLGIKVAGFEAWDPKASSYEALMNKIKGTGADAVFLGGLIDENGAQVIKDKVAVLGPNDGAVKLFAPDGFTHAVDDRRVRRRRRGHVPVRRRRADRRSSTGTAQEFIDAL